VRLGLAGTMVLQEADPPCLLAEIVEEVGVDQHGE